MIPLIDYTRELEMMKAIVDNAAEQVFAAKGTRVKYKVGTMIELPRAALMADEIAKVAEFFSFGTNDLTQTTLGMSRDDAGVFIGVYKAKNIFLKDPFASIDTKGVGQLVEMAALKSRRV